MNNEKIKEKGSITKWMYVKESKWLPVIYTPFQDIESFCSIYCKGKDWIPLIEDIMMKKIEQEMLAECKHEPTERERLEIKIKAGRKAQKIRKFFWDSAMEINDNWSFPFVIRMRHLTKQ